MNDIHDNIASVLTDGALADRLRMIGADVRAFSADQRAAFLAEAARRIERPTVADTLRAHQP